MLRAMGARNVRVLDGGLPKWRAEGHPVESVSWHNAMEFCRRLTESLRASGTLPDGHEVYKIFFLLRDQISLKLNR
jgi:hypothetical protein